MPDEMEQLFQRLITALLKKSVLEDDDISIRIIVQLPVMYLVTVDKKEYRRLDVIAVAVYPMLATAPGKIDDLKILLMLMGWRDKRTLAKGFHLNMFFRADLILGWDLLFQRW